jgi:hypothetical protein
VKINLNDPRTAQRAMLALAAIAVAVLVLALMAACNTLSRAEQCVAEGGTVEVETKYKYEYKNLKPTTITEHECIKDGVEIDEW